jgi:type IV secretion system protein VirB6
MNAISTTPDNKQMTHHRLLAFILAAVCFILIVVASSNAIASTPPPVGEQVCSANSLGVETDQFRVDPKTIITDIVIAIKLKLILMSTQIYNNILTHPGFIVSVRAAITLYIAIYGILFMSGLVSMTLYDFVIRCTKIGILSMLITTTSSWAFFNDTVVRFFNGGTDELITYVTNSGRPALVTPPLPLPMPTDVVMSTGVFTGIDSAINKVISNKMFATLMATSLTGPYGPIMFALLLAGVGLFLKSVMTAVWVYVMSLLLKTLLFGLAPIFIPTILFSRTRHLFDNWLNQLLGASLQPVLLFTFFIFFVKLMEGSLDNILSHPICWTKFPDGLRGSGFDFSFWRFMEFRGGTEGWVMDEKEWTLDKGFPIPIISILTLLAIAEIASKFNDVVINIAMQIAQSSVNLSAGNPVDKAVNMVSSGASQKMSAKSSK